jgi:cytochrome c oxidase assembly factor CtaG
MSTKRRSFTADWLPWAVAAAIIAALAVAVTRFLSSSGSSHGLNVSDAMSRGMASTSDLPPLLGWRLVTAWQLDAAALAVLALIGAWYLGAVLRARRNGHDWPLTRVALFVGGLAVCAFATNGSIAVYDMVLFSAHMIGHLLLVMVGPALLVAGRPLDLAIAASEEPDHVRGILRNPVVSAIFAPPVALACYTVVIVGSHLTGLMNTIMLHTWAGQLEHLVYLVIGFQFFSLVISPPPIRWRLGSPARWLLLAIAMAVDTFTGLVLLQGTTVISMASDPRLSVNALSDTHTGGAIMWFGGDAIMAAVMLALVLSWLRDPDRERGEGWLERSRRAHFAERTHAPGQPVPDLSTDTDFDENDDQLAAYNRWLTSINRDGR